ncbi:DUF6339 family protein [Streptomyces hydrogenans]|uniref:DUF6339 family protein n=1 Tax=Streptomyces hydrogenans TaxID=1873719 RepID=UPI003439C0B6
MSVLYPRLLPGEADILFAALHKHPAGTHLAMVSNRSPRSVYAATGGRRVTTDELDDLRNTIHLVAKDQGFPDLPASGQRTAFDRQVARILHEQSGMVPGEAAQRQVWAFLSLVLLPDVCAWRWPPSADGKYAVDRFKGTDLTRHALARLWTRAHILHVPKDDDPYALLSVMGEADLDQVMARRHAIASTPELVRAVVRVHSEGFGEPLRGTSSREVLRQCLMRLLRLTAFIDPDALSAAELNRLVRTIRQEVVASLQGT